MATNPRRVTVVDPWIVGGEGQFRDLFSLPPLLLLSFRAIGWFFKHYLFTASLLTSLWLWVAEDWSWWAAFLIFPTILILTRLLLTTLYLWYRNPTIPLFARR